MLASPTNISTSDGLKSLPLINIGGKSLISRTVEIINRVGLIDSVEIFASENKIMSYISDDVKCNFIERNKSLDSSNTSIEDIIASFLSKSDADIIVLVHPKSPFIRPKTIEECIEKVLSEGFDSAFIANKIKRQAWYKGKPLNYLIDKDTPALTKLDPILIESSSIYVFTRALFKKSRNRIGENPYIKEVGHFEGFEVDNKDDLTMAELMINAGLDKDFN